MSVHLEGRLGQSIVALLSVCVLFLVVLGWIVLDTKAEIIRAYGGRADGPTLRTTFDIGSKTHSIETPRRPEYGSGRTGDMMQAEEHVERIKTQLEALRSAGI